MARTKRKVNPVTGAKAQTEPAKPKYIVAGYVRLSHEAGEHPSSIETQKEMIRQFVENQTDMVFHHFYIDSAASSFSRARTEFEQLINDVKNRTCNCIVVKDLSRFGRDYIETGRYIFEIFPFIDIRFIALTDRYDSINFDIQDHFSLGMRTIANHFYALDVSKKVKSVVHFKQKEGSFILSKVPFGYQKIGTGSKATYIIDENVAKIVVEIFELRKAGLSPYQIAKELNLRNVPSPKQYAGVIKDGYWCVGTIRGILYNRFYTGAYVAGKSEHHLVGRFTKNISPDNWTIIENHHDAIITNDVFESVQQVKPKANEILRVQYHKNLPTSFDARIHCGYCGRRMKKQGVSKSETDKYYYICPTYADSGGVRCKYNRIRADKLKSIVFDRLQEQIQAAVEHQERQRNFESTANHKLWMDYRVQIINECEQQLRKYRNEKGAGTWERAVEGKGLSLLDFSGIHRYEESKIEQLERQLAEAHKEIGNYIKHCSSKAEWVMRYLQFKDADKLNEKMVEQLIEKVLMCDGRLKVVSPDSQHSSPFIV